MQQLIHRFDDLPSGAIIGLLAETLTDPEYSELVQDLLTGEIPALVEEVLRRAVARGEIGSTGTARTRRLPLDLLRSEIFLRAATPTDEYIEETVDEILLPLYSST